MDADLKEELDEGERAAHALAEHLRKMGAAKATIPVIIDDEKYEVVVTYVPVEPLSGSEESS